MLKTNLCGIELQNPLIMASGTFGYGVEFSPYMDISKLGGVCSTGITLYPKEGNPGPRAWEFSGGMMNSVGLQNPGMEAFIQKKLPLMIKFCDKVIVNLGGNTLEEYISGAQLLDATNADFIELNISCPNVAEGGMAFGMDPDSATTIVTEVKKATSKPLIVKLSPNAPNIVDIGMACEKAGADGLSLVNTFQGMAINIFQKKPVFNNVYAGVSGPGIKPIALRMVHDVCRAVSVPVVGLGGISSGLDVIEFIMAGATAVQIGTANFKYPTRSLEILEETEKLCRQLGISSLDEIRGVVLKG